MIVGYVKKELLLPEGAVNVACATNGASARASACSPGFEPSGAIDGDRSLRRWGKGSGWQAPSPAWHPNWWGEWIEVDLPRAEAIDTVLVFSFPAMAGGRFWRGLDCFHVQYLSARDGWVTLESVSGNRDKCRVLRFAEVVAKAVRVHVTRMHYPEEAGYETGFTPTDESPRIVEIEAYRLGSAGLYRETAESKEVVEGKKGRAAVLLDEDFGGPAGFLPGIVEALRGAGWGVTALDAEEACEPELLNAHNFDLFLHPYGKYAPLGINLIDFLQGGGHLVTLGGRAFTAMKQRISGVWTDLGMDPGITASAGRYNDSIRPYREQLGIFTIPHSRLKHADSVCAAGGQSIVNGVCYDRPVEGWMACGMTGELLPLDESALYASEGRLPAVNHMTRQGIHDGKWDEHSMWGMDETYPPLFSHPCARWIPLLNAFDRFGRGRGPASALLMHYEGIWRGSNWAFFGVEDEAFYCDGGVVSAVVDAAGFISGAICLHSLEPEYACYRQGEEVLFSSIVDNCATDRFEGEIRFEVLEYGSEEPVYERTLSVALPAGEWSKLQASWRPVRFDCDLYRLRASMTASGRTIDSEENGFVVWDERVLESGPDVEFRDNYFHFGGEARYTVGSRDSGLHLPGQPDENPLGWDRQYAMMRDFGMRITSPVHIDWLIPGLGWGELDCANPVPEAILRRMDAQVQLAQKHGLIYAPGLFFAYENQAMHDLVASRAICEAFGRRYAKAPGILFYLADDCLMHDPALFDRWVKTCVDALNSSGRTYMVTVEYGFRQDWPDMLRHTCRRLTFNSGSCFQRTVGDPVYDRLVDMRPAGKSFTYGEFVRRIPSGSEEDLHGYLAPPHLNFGMGYAMCMNWKWRTSWHAIWPSDVVFPGGWVPKDHLYAFRNEAFFFRQFRPVYRSPELLVVLPSSVWLKNTEAMTRHLVAFLRGLMAASVDFACIDDTDLGALPPGTKALVCPMPVEMGDEAFRILKDFVGCGGFLLLTGDVSRVPGDAPGKAGRPERLSELFGLRRVGYAHTEIVRGLSMAVEGYQPVQRACTEKSKLKTQDYDARPLIEAEAERAETLIVSEDGSPLLTRSPYGNGEAWFTPDRNPALPPEVFAAFLERAGVRRNRVSPDLPNLHCFRADTLDGFAYTLTTFPWDGGLLEAAVSTEAGDVRLTLRGQALGVVHANNGGFVDALETQGMVTVNGVELLETDAHVMLTALDGKAIGQSGALLVYPISAGMIKVMNGELDHAEAGETVQGSWKLREELEACADGRSVSFEVSPLNLTNLILLCRKEKRGSAAALAREALLR